MDKQRLISLLCGLLPVLFLAGCEIVTEQNPPGIIKPAGSLVVNEVFILPPPSPNSHYWIEFFNPTGHPVNITGWTIGFKTSRFVLTYNFPTPDPGRLTGGTFDSVKQSYDVPLEAWIRADTIGRPGGTTIPTQIVDASSFLTYVSDLHRMEDYTSYGPGNGDHFEGSQFITNLHYFYRADTLIGSLGQDSIIISQLDSLVFTGYIFSLETTDQFVLKDSTGTPVDVFRYGNYVYSGPGNDPYSGNQSLGPVVPFQSYARFADGYKTGAYSNSAEDFYVTGVQIPYTVPIPMWLSQAYKH